MEKVLLLLLISTLADSEGLETSVESGSHQRQGIANDRPANDAEYGQRNNGNINVNSHGNTEYDNDVHGNNDNETQGHQSITPTQEDMGTTQEDMGTTQDDMGATTVLTPREERMGTTVLTPREARMRQQRVQRESRRVHRIQSIQDYVMNHFNWTQPPVIDQTTKNRLMANIRNHCYSASCGLPPHIDPELWHEEGGQSVRLYFNVTSATNTGVIVQDATLKLHMKGCHCTYKTEDELHILVYRLMKLRRRRRLQGERNAPRRRLLISRLFRWEDNTWLTFTVTETLKTWVRHSRRNNGFEIIVKDLADQVLDAHAIFDNVDCNTQGGGIAECRAFPVLQSETDEVTVSTTPVLQVQSIARLPRQKRDVDGAMGSDDALGMMGKRICQNDCSTGINDCRNASVWVKFTSPWIIAPRGYRTTVCVGKCRHCSDQSGNTECDREPGTCQPTVTEPLTLTYMDDNDSIRLLDVPDLIVKECGCVN